MLIDLLITLILVFTIGLISGIALFIITKLSKATMTPKQIIKFWQLVRKWI